MTAPEKEAEVKRFTQLLTSLRERIRETVVGQDEAVEGLLSALFVGGHVLLEGAPGLGKTLLVRTLGAATGLEFSRIQFTPDLMPADVVGTNLLVERDGGRRFEFQRGPIFTNLLLADEINRATPKTQSALLEAMQEHHATVSGVTHPMPDPFLVLATQNPLEMEGTYPLPEAQLDRFLLKVLVDYPGRADLHTILERTTSADLPESKPALNCQALADYRKLVREVVIAPDIRDRLVQLTLATHPQRDESTDSAKRYVRYGASPRGAQAILLCAKFHALRSGRFHVATDDLLAVAIPALRHRVILNFEGESEGITSAQVIADAMATLPAS